MNATQLNAAGYRVGTLVDGDLINRIDGIVRESYIVPIIGTIQQDDTDAESAAQQLVVIALGLQNTIVTRAGAKVKLSPSLSDRAYNVTQTDYENAHRLLKKLQARPGATQGRLDGIVDDVLHIYFRSYLSMN